MIEVRGWAGAARAGTPKKGAMCGILRPEGAYARKHVPCVGGSSSKRGTDTLVITYNVESVFVAESGS